MFYEYIHDKMLPKMIRQYMEKDDSDTSDLMNLDVYRDNDFIGVTEELSEQKKSYLQQHGLENICQSTLFTCMISIGMKYCEFSTNYYVDNYKREANMIYLWYFVKQLFEQETRIYRWIQMTRKRSDQLQKYGKFVEGRGYNYETPEGIGMVEYHVHAC